jgi:hypothetical protein
MGHKRKGVRWKTRITDTPGRNSKDDIRFYFKGTREYVVR